MVGQKVHAGDPLLTLDCPDATGSRAAAQVADAALREANLELERQRRMQQEGVGIERDLVAAETKVSAAEAEVKREEAVNASLGSGTAGAVVVRAPIDGVVTSRKANVGMSVERGGEPLVEVGDPDALRVVADVFERDLPGILPGASAEFSFATSDHPLHGKVSGEGEVVGSGLRTAQVFLSLSEKGVALRPGMYGRAKIELADASITLPVSAVLIKDGRDPIVYVQRDAQTFERRSVKLAQPVEGRVQVLSGLRQGDKVVVRGALLLDGAADQLL
jgi:cobalt-zinc-cadmium efflux system membrane fusion protein